MNREMWTIVVDVVVSLVLYFAGKYGTPSLFADVQTVILALQAIFGAIFFGPTVRAFVRAKLAVMQTTAKLNNIYASNAQAAANDEDTPK